jgi:cytochrome c oxidase subunit 2
MRSNQSLVALAALAVIASVLPGGARAEDLKRGAEIFQLCTQCHQAGGEGSQLALAPTLAGLAPWWVGKQLESFKTGVRGTNPEDTAGLRMYPMSQTLKTPEDVAAVTAYVATLPAHKPPTTLTGGDPTHGAQLYQVCTPCHGVDASGNQAIGAPALANQSDWYLLVSLQKYQAGIRSRDNLAAVMRGMASTLPDDQAKKDVIAYIVTLKAQTPAASAAAK